MSHFTDGNQMPVFTNNGIQPLTADMFASPDDINTIAGFYRAKLKGFEKYRVEQDIIYIDNGPATFDYV